jgi:hypothetical protein
MHDAASELPRIPIARTPVNKGKKDRSVMLRPYGLLICGWVTWRAAPLSLRSESPLCER